MASKFVDSPTTKAIQEKKSSSCPDVREAILGYLPFVLTDPRIAMEEVFAATHGRAMTHAERRWFAQGQDD